MIKLFSFILVIFFISCGGKKETIKEVYTPLPEELRKRLEFLPNLDNPNLKLSTNEQKVLDFIKSKIKYGGFTLLINKREEYGSTQYDEIEFLDNFLFTLNNSDSYIPFGFFDFDYIFSEVGYEIVENKIKYCEYGKYIYSENQCQSGTEEGCSQTIKAPCKAFYASCNLSLTDIKCFQNIQVGNDGSLQFTIIPNYKTKICERNYYYQKIKYGNSSDFYYNWNSKEICNQFFSLPNEINFKLTFEVNKDGTYKIRDQNGFYFDEIRILKFLPEIKH